MRSAAGLNLLEANSYDEDDAERTQTRLESGWLSVETIVSVGDAIIDRRDRLCATAYG